MNQIKKNILRYSYKENYINRYKNCNSVDDIHKSKTGIDKYEKEKYFEKFWKEMGQIPIILISEINLYFIFPT